MRTAVLLVAMLASQVALADIAERVAAGKAAMSKKETASYSQTVATRVGVLLQECALPGVEVAPADAQLTLVGDISATGQVSNIEATGGGAVATCLVAQLQKAPLPVVPPARIVGKKGFPLVVEMTLLIGFQSKPVVAATPVHSQLVAITHPAEFGPPVDATIGSIHIRQFIPKGESFPHFSQMLSLSGYKDALQNPKATLSDLVTRTGSSYKTNCPTSFAAKEVGSLKISGHDAVLVLFGCGTNMARPPRSETIMILAIKGKADMYSIQWSEFGSPQEQAPVLDEAKWKARLQQLLPIRICNRVADEAPPYLSCLDQSAVK
jgi:hypothetical protein